MPVAIPTATLPVSGLGTGSEYAGSHVTEARLMGIVVGIIV